MSAYKYPSIFPCQMEAIVYIIFMEEGPVTLHGFQGGPQ